MEKIIDGSYDGAANLSGQYDGIQTENHYPKSTCRVYLEYGA